MIFSPAHARLVLEGRKSQTRRRVRPGETVCRWVPGRSYAVQHDRGKRAVGRDCDGCRELAAEVLEAADAVDPLRNPPNRAGIAPAGTPTKRIWPDD